MAWIARAEQIAHNLIQAGTTYNTGQSLWNDFITELHSIEGAAEHGARDIAKMFGHVREKLTKKRGRDAEDRNTPPKAQKTLSFANLQGDEDTPPVVHGDFNIGISPAKTTKRKGGLQPIALAMDTDMEGGSSGIGVNSIGSETRVTSTKKIDYGFHETYTTLMKWDCYFTPYNLNHGGGAPNAHWIKFRMNSIWDMFANSNPSTLSNSLTPSLVKPAVNGNTFDLNDKLFPGPDTSTKMLVLPVQHVQADYVDVVQNGYPKLLTVGTVNNTLEAPNFRAWHATMYEFYTVVKAEWTLHVRNPLHMDGADLLVVWNYQNDDTGYLPNDISLADLLQQKGMHQHLVRASCLDHPDKNYITISDTYIRGQHQRDIREDEKARIWLSTGATNNTPALREDVRFWFFKAPMCTNKIKYYDNQAASLVDNPSSLTDVQINPTFALKEAYLPICCNCHFSIDYTVQFKDLVQSFRWPSATVASKSLDLPADYSEVLGGAT